VIDGDSTTLIQISEKCFEFSYMHVSFGGTTVRESDFDYFRRRAAEERQAAESATDPAARRVHLDLARRYDDAVEAEKSRPAIGMGATVHAIEPKLGVNRGG
jgi:hypothetical protein